MSVVNIQFDSFDLQDDTYKTENIIYRHVGEKQIQKKPDPRKGGFDIAETKYTQKIITLEGRIYGSSEADLRSSIDNLKKSLRSAEKNLDIDYGDEKIRYTATMQSMEVPEERWHTTELPFIIEFITLPWGTSTNSKTENWTSITNSSYTNSVSISGSFSPSPTIQITSNENANLDIKFTNDTTSDWISTESTQSFSTNSVFEVDTDNETVTLDGSNIDFEGVFPVFDPESNAFTVTVSGGTPDFDISLSYYPTYL